MKKTLFALGTAALALLATPAAAQYYYLPGSVNGNPGGLNADSEYPVGGGLATSWTTISAAPAASPAWSTVQTLPFAFNFNGSPVTQYKVSTSGVLTFDANAATAPSYTKAALPNAGIPDNSVCIWGLASTGTNDLIVNKTFGTAPNRQHWVMFSSYGIPNNTCWTYWAMVLEESTNKIYVVDQRNSCTGATFAIGIQVNSTTAYSVNGSPNVAAQAGTDATPGDNKYYEFIPGTQPSNNLIANSLNVADYLVLNQAPFTIAASYLNGGANAVTSATVNYKVNNGATVSGSASGVNMAPAATGTLTHPTVWTPSATGTYTLKFWTSNPNGQTDPAPQNDTVTKQVVVVSNIAVRRPFIEVFSSSTCPPCAPANATFKTLMDAQPAGDYNYIKYQMSWPGTGDPYYTAEAGAKRTLYGVNSVPNAQIDGGWNGHAGQITQPILNSFKAKPSFINISGYYDRIGAGPSGASFDIYIDILPLVTITKPLSLQVAIYEKFTTQNVKSNGETVFYNVMKKMVPDANGTALTNLTENVLLISGSNAWPKLSYTFNGIYRLPPNATQPVNHLAEHTVENFPNLGVMVWIQDMTTKEIYQSADLTASGVGLGEETANAVRVTPNPANQTAVVSFGEHTSGIVRVVNALGQTVYAAALNGENTLALPVAAWTNGLYVVEFTNGAERTTQRFQVAH